MRDKLVINEVRCFALFFFYRNRVSALPTINSLSFEYFRLIDTIFFVLGDIAINLHDSSMVQCYLLDCTIAYQVKRMLSTMPNPLVAVCQMTSTSDKKKNYQVVSQLVAEAKNRNACFAFFPEACDYLADNKKDIVAFAESLDGPTISSYKKLAAEHNIWLSLGGLHEKESENDEKIFNSHVLINNEGTLVAAYRKMHLFDMENKETGVRLMESDYVMKGNEITPPINTPIGSLGLSICYDMRFAELSLALRNMGAQILTFPSAFTYQTGAAHWEVLLRARAIETQCYVIAAAQTGTHNKKRVSWGHAMIVDPWGSVIAQCHEKTGIAIAEIDLELMEKVRKNMPCENHRRVDLYPMIKPLN